MITAFNTMFKNEERLLSEVLPIWEKYPIDLFIFYNDNSTDSSVDVIKKLLPKNRYIIINHRLSKFNESYQRQAMIDVSREQDVDYIFSIDCDELLTSNIVQNFEEFIKIYDQQDMMLYWYNSVNNSLKYHRNDSQYVNNYRTFILPLKHTSSLNTNDWKYHTPRTPYVNLPKNATKEYGVLHLQALDRKFYAIKQLWYKHYELVNYNHSVDFINSRYDIVVNNLNFEEKETDDKLIQGININPNIFDGLEIEKGYLDFIHKNYNENLVTFGKEYI